jgi:hypothetical protein
MRYLVLKMFHVRSHISLYLIFKFSALIMAKNIIIMNFANTSKHIIFFMKYHLLKDKVENKNIQLKKG